MCEMNPKNPLLKILLRFKNRRISDLILENTLHQSQNFRALKVEIHSNIFILLTMALILYFLSSVFKNFLKHAQRCGNLSFYEEKTDFKAQTKLVGLLSKKPKQENIKS